MDFINNFTFGVEYELKLRITVDQLQEELSSDLTTKQIQVATNPGQRTTLVNKVTGEQCEFRGYSTEALRIVQKHIQAIPGYEAITIYQGSGKQADFSSAPVYLTHDASLNGLNKAAKIATGLCTPDQADITDFVGTEIVTAPRDSPQEACDEAHKISAALRSDGLDYHIDDECAMHIHVGKQDGTHFDIKTLQHLAYLVLIYEHEFARMTIPRKRGGDFETRSNRLDFATECPSPETHRAYVCDQEGNISEGSIRKALFEKVDLAEDPHKAFVKLMGDKGHIVNFSYSARDIRNNEPAATVEFRQHQGTLDGDDVLHWSRHCTALVALAQKYADNNARYPVTTWEDNIDIEQLWREMKLPESTKQFYRNRIQEFDERWPDVHQTPLCEPDMVFDDDFSFSDEESEGSAPSMTEDDVEEEC
ncbi:unnamed protein product [Aureobasidium vineae]|uniref:Amidoligase enzyme n=1 Tax=Aureobasidium vineae TaxID=2773715 RepID=A0A9N8P4K4_9PEZI|nr:unnamed protein product [Aureobasidium vineae]